MENGGWELDNRRKKINEQSIAEEGPHRNRSGNELREKREIHGFDTPAKGV